MVIQPHKIYKLKLKDGEEFTAEAVQFTIHTIIFKDKSKKFEIKREDIKTYKMVKDLTDVPVKQAMRGTTSKDRNRPVYQRKELF